jgi:DNA-binding NarL/FixJ family response regulator
MTRVLIVATIRLYREGLAQLLSANGEFAVVGTESTGREAVERVDETAPDVTLVDMDIPDLGDISSAFATRLPRIPLVAVGVTESDSIATAPSRYSHNASVKSRSSCAKTSRTRRSLRACASKWRPSRITSTTSSIN